MLEEYFKYEDRTRGEETVARNAVTLASTSDSFITAFIRGSSACKVSLSSEGVASSRVSAACSCSSGRRGILCKHVWAVILKLNGHDFLDGKTEITTRSESKAPPMSARATEVRKAFAEKQKERMKKIRLAKKGRVEAPTFSYPEAVEAARAFFLANGFELQHPLAIEPLLQAKKLLSRVFHPDKGGSHEETVELNQHFTAIADYLKG